MLNGNDLAESGDDDANTGPFTEISSCYGGCGPGGPVKKKVYLEWTPTRFHSEDEGDEFLMRTRIFNLGSTSQEKMVEFPVRLRLLNSYSPKFGSFSDLNSDGEEICHDYDKVELVLNPPLPEGVTKLSWSWDTEKKDLDQVRYLDQVDLERPRQEGKPLRLNNGVTFHELNKSYRYITNEVKIYVCFKYKVEEKPRKHKNRSLTDLLASSCLTDMMFVCDGQEFPCHKVILAAQSSVFKAMFEGNSFKESKDGIVQIKDMTPGELETMIEFVYTRKAKGLGDLATAKNLLAFADKYDLKELKNACGMVIEDNLDDSNAIDFLVFACNHNASLLKKAALKFIKRSCMASSLPDED